MNVLTDLEEDALREIGYIGAGHAATALSKMIGDTVDVELVLSSISPVTSLPKAVGERETLVTGVYLPISGDVEGVTLVVFPKRSALLMADLLLKREPGTVKSLGIMDESALKEVGNILSGSCLTALSSLLEIHLVEHVPSLATGMLGALMDNIAVQLGREAEQSLILGLNMTTRTDIKILVFFFLLFALEEVQVILRAIKARVGVE